jgi:hypothetical protein
VELFSSNLALSVDVPDRRLVLFASLVLRFLLVRPIYFPPAKMGYYLQHIIGFCVKKANVRFLAFNECAKFFETDFALQILVHEFRQVFDLGSDLFP